MSTDSTLKTHTIRVSIIGIHELPRLGLTGGVFLSAICECCIALCSRFYTVLRYNEGLSKYPKVLAHIDLSQ